VADFRRVHFSIFAGTEQGINQVKAYCRADIISRQNAGRSTGVREVMMLPSRTTSRSTNLPPAFCRSSLME
jgi:hypothetical protein